MVRPYAGARLAGVTGEGLVVDRLSRFVFQGSEEDASPLSDALKRKRAVRYRGPAIGRDGSVHWTELDVRILVIERVAALTEYHFVCTLTPLRPAAWSRPAEGPRDGTPK